MANKKKSSKATGSKKSAVKKNTKTITAKKTNLKVVGGQEKAVKAAAAVLSNRSNDAVDSGARVVQTATKKIVTKKPAVVVKKTPQKASVKASQNVDDTSKIINNAISQNQEQLESIVACGNKGTDASREIGEQITEYTNKWLDKQIEVSKELMECRTFNDLFELQSRVTSEAMESLFDESTKISEIIVGYASEASEPLQKSFAEATENLSKTFNA